MNESIRPELYLKAFFETVTLDKIMNRQFSSLYESDKLSSAQRKFLDNKASHIVVVDTDKRLVGILSQKYLFKTKSPRKIISPDQMAVNRDMMLDKESYYDKEMLDSYNIASVMYKSPTTLKVKDTMADVIELMSDQNISCVCVVNDLKQVKGIITHREIVDYISIIITSN